MFVEILYGLFSWMQSPWYWIIALVGWYIYYGLECMLNGSEPGLLIPFKWFVKDLTWAIPGGLRRRTEYFKENVMPSPSSIDGKRHGTISGTISWDYDWVADNNLYEDCAKDNLPGPFHFWFYSVLCPIFWPLTLVILAVLIVICIPLNLFEPVFKPLFDKYFDRKETRFKARIESKIAIRNT